MRRPKKNKTRESFSYLFTSLFVSTSCFAIFSHNFFRSKSSSSGLSAFDFANSRSPFSNARSTLF